MAKFIFVVGGVYSGTGKGISAASIGLLLKMRGAKVQLIKCDPYLNINAGTMNPRQHGECFLCDDGSETDLDLGHYERITGIEMSSRNIFTNGTLHEELRAREVRGDYLGDTVQVAPHLTDLIQERVEAVGKDADIVIAEIGGTVGDIESSAFYEALRQFKLSRPNDVLVMMVTPIIYNTTVKEFKTKPLQNAVKELRGNCLQPDILLCRIDREMPDSILDKVARLTNMEREAVFSAPDVKSIYQVPIEFWARHIDDLIADKFHLRRVGCRIHKYKDLVEAYLKHDGPSVKIGIVGKYENHDEAYVSLKEALTHAAVASNAKLEIVWLAAEEIVDGDWKQFDALQGVVVPGGFDIRGVDGKIQAIKRCREKKIPFLGICLGLQCAVIEFARNVLGLVDATSEEFDKGADHKVIHYIEGQEKVTKMSGTMRLGSYECELKKDSLIHTLYKARTITERHRHRYEVNGDYVEKYEEKGFYVTGTHPNGGLVEMMELDQKAHPYFIGTQAHPEFKSRLQKPSALFVGLIAAAIEKLQT
jgi:CTP synthase